MKRRKKVSLLRKIIEQIAFLVGIVLLWQLAFYLGVEVFHIWKSYSMPSPTGVFESLKKLLENGSLIDATENSLVRGAYGYCISIIVGMVLGFFINHFDFLNRNMRPVIMGVQTLPSICWVPFSILWFGLSEEAIIFVVVMGSAFSIAVAVDNAIENVPSIYKKAALTMGANKRQLYFRVILPACLPELISGLKQGWSFAWRALMSGEVMTTSISLGQTLITGRNLADINQVMLVMVVIVLVGILIDQLVFSTVERHMRRKRGL